MNEPDTLITALLKANDHVSVQGNWIASVHESLKGISAEEAAWKPGPEERSIFEIVLHITVWTDWAANFLRGRDTETTEWPPVTNTDTAAWENARIELDRALSNFRARIAALTAPDLTQIPIPDVTQTNNLTGLLSIIIHNAYHAGQITKLHERWQSR